MAERTGLEPATTGVTGRYSNQLNYRSQSTNARSANATHAETARIEPTGNMLVGADGLEPPTFAL